MADKSDFPLRGKTASSVRGLTNFHLRGQAGIPSEGPEGSRAADEYKQALFYHGMRKWTQSSGISCFLFEAFDEPWKSASNPTDSENHFGLFTAEGEAKYAVWSWVKEGVFEGLTRDGHAIKSSYEGQRELLDRHVLLPAS